MSVPFSNTHLRIPRGFGSILEGLAREVIRDQPEDIPEYAAQYFEALLKQREESGMDPAEWAAKLEDRFYNNHAFKATGASAEKEPAAETTISQEKSYESQTEDESSHSAEASNLSTTQRMAQYEAKQETAVIDKDIVDSEGEENTEVEEPAVAIGYSGLADVDVCVTELRGTEQTVERATAENDSHDVEEENMKPQPEETLEQSSLSQYETPEGNQG
ncbi:sperm surface protein Sp17 isoform X1 [Lates japonicus]|uniref:Sperm surface protein Sp17 isoform X1 n=1 Tax=Lates japonicus TaxID=270547 RepID=A0AAD3MPK0_LATJO|nr:sperm surface protein Sp17 isoform X1 [Lates japonicus]